MTAGTGLAPTDHPKDLAPFGQTVRSYLRKLWVRCLILGIIGAASRLPALQGDLVWDDSFLVRDNPFSRSPIFVLEVFRHHLFLDSYSAHYRPVQNLSLMADYFFWNSNTYGYHLTNVLLHVASGILLFFLLRRIVPSITRVVSNRSEGIAFFVALLWVVHPVHSAAIDYISGRADSLAFALSCSGWLLALRARETGSGRLKAVLYCSAGGFAVLGLCSREIALVWIVLFIVHHLLFEQASWRAKLLPIACCFVVVAIYMGLRSLPEKRAAKPPSQDWPGPVRAVLMLRSLGDYGRLMVFPSNLHMERSVFNPRNYLDNSHWRRSAGTEYLSIAGLLVCAAFAAGGFGKSPGRKLRLFGAGWFVAGYLPISNIVDLNATAAEHWLYLPSVGLLLFVGGCVLDLRPRHWRIATALGCIAVIGLSARSTVRSSDWSSGETFYRRTLAAGGYTSRVGANLAQIYANRGEYEKAEKLLRKVLEMTPDYPIARNNLAEVLLRQGRKDEGEQLLASTTKATESTRKEYPRTWIAVLNLALFHFNQGDNDTALAITEKARRDYPGVWEAVKLEAEILRQTQGPESALALIGEFARENWWHYPATMAQARLYAELSNVELAEKALRRASWLDVHDAESLNFLATIRVRQNRLADACAVQRRAVARQPDAPRQYMLLSDILNKMGRAEEARAAIAKVTELQALARTPVVAN